MEDDWTGAAAALKTIRDNRIKTGMEDVAYETFTGQEMIDFIRAERRRELAFRGLRWYDLRRYAVLPKYQLKTTIRHAVYEWGDNAAVSRPMRCRTTKECWWTTIVPTECWYNNL